MDREKKNTNLEEVIKRPRVGRSMVNTLGQDICTGVFPERLPMPNESELCERYSVSRTVIRETLNVVESKGLVSRKSRSGTKVNPQSDWCILDEKVIEWLGPLIYETNILKSVLEARCVIEPAAARMAAERANLQQIADLENSLKAMSQAKNNLRQFNKADLDFHYILLSASHNRVFQELASSFQAAIKCEIEVTSMVADSFDEAITLHATLVEALRVRNSDMAHTAMLQILELAAHDLAVVSRYKNECD